MTATPEIIDLAAVKHRQQTMWSSGDFGVIASLIHIVAERLADSADLVAGSRVLDVAGGTGNAAIAAARCGCHVTCTDYVPALLERGRQRALAEQLAIEFVEADAEALPCEDGEYDAVLSVFGACSPPTSRAPPPSCCACAVPAGASASRAGRRTASSASCSAPPPPTSRRPPASRRRCAGAPRRA